MTDLRSSAILRSVEWQSFTDVSGQPVRSTFKGQEVTLFFSDFLTLEDDQ
jgi:hypothetical protein